MPLINALHTPCRARNRQTNMTTPRLHLCRRNSAFTLIELLVVITIIGVLAGMAFPVVTGVMERARKVKCLSTIKDLNVAINAYRTEYNHYPSEQKQEDEIRTNAASKLIQVLLAAESQQKQDGLNPRGVKFIDLPPAKNGRGGLIGTSSDNYELVDEWGKPYYVIMDTDGDDKVKNPDLRNSDPKISGDAPQELPLGVAVYSLGADGEKSATPTRKAITSWRG